MYEPSFYDGVFYMNDNICKQMNIHFFKLIILLNLHWGIINSLNELNYYKFY